MNIDFPVLIPKFDKILERGLCSGLGAADGQMCIEAAITQCLGLPFGDNPSCVTPAVRSYKIALNDKIWSSPQARAAGLRNLGIAQIGSAGVVDDSEFLRRLAEKTIRVLIPALFRELFPDKPALLAVADRCEKEGTKEAAREARRLAAAADADADAYSAAYAAAAAADAAADAAANAAADAAAKPRTDKYLLLSASLALDVLRELKSPGCEWLDWKEAAQ